MTGTAVVCCVNEGNTKSHLEVCKNKEVTLFSSKFFILIGVKDLTPDFSAQGTPVKIPTLRKTPRSRGCCIVSALPIIEPLDACNGLSAPGAASDVF